MSRWHLVVQNNGTCGNFENCPNSSMKPVLSTRQASSIKTRAVVKIAKHRAVDLRNSWSIDGYKNPNAHAGEEPHQFEASSSFPSLFFTTRYLKMICSSTCSRPHSSEAWVKAEVWLIKKLPIPWPKQVKQKQTHAIQFPGNKNLNSLGFFHKDLWNLGSSGDSTKFLIYDIPWPSNTQTNHNAWHTPSCTKMCPQLLPIGPNLDIIFGRGRCHGNQRREDGKVKRGPIAFHRWWGGYMRWTWQAFMIGYEEWIEIEGTQWYDYWLHKRVTLGIKESHFGHKYTPLHSRGSLWAQKRVTLGINHMG